MKKQISILATLLLLVNVTHAAILRCNNNPLAAGPNVYATAQAAHDAASPGDTIHLEPTTFGSYGNLDVYKKITIISIGDFLDINIGNQVGTNPSRVSNISIYNGADDCTISCYVDNYITINANNTTIKNARATGIYANSWSNTTIKQSFIGTIYSSNAPNLVIQNNYIWDNCSLPGNYGTVILNNIIRSHPNYGSSNFENAILSNNIFWSSGAGYNFANCTFSNNICDISSLPIGFGNINGVDINTVFQTIGVADLYQLNPTYPNQNIGMFAGNEPYKLAMQPAIPAIYQLTNAGTNNGNNLQIQVSTKSNN